MKEWFDDPKQFKFYSIKFQEKEYQLLPDGVDLDTGARWGASEDTKINAINSIFLMYKHFYYIFHILVLLNLHFLSLTY